MGDDLELGNDAKRRSSSFDGLSRDVSRKKKVKPTDDGDTYKEDLRMVILIRPHDSSIRQHNLCLNDVIQCRAPETGNRTQTPDRRVSTNTDLGTWERD